MTATNPLLQKSTLKNQAPEFDKYRPDDFVPAVKEAIEGARKNIEAIKNNPAAPTFENTIVALETASEQLSDVSSIFDNLSSVVGAGIKSWTKREMQIGKMQSAFGNDVSLDPVIFARVKAVYDARANLNLSGEDMMLLENTYKGFERSGANLNDADKKRYREISMRMSEIVPQYSANVAQSAAAFELWVDKESDLSGLPDNVKSAGKDAAAKKGKADKWLFTLDGPTYVAFVTYADNRDLREKLWRAWSDRAYKDKFDNTALAQEIASLRDERAKLLGYKNHADFVLTERMAADQKTVFDFLDKLKDAYKPAAEEDFEEIKKFTANENLPGGLKPWDVSYYSEKYKEQKFGYSDEDIRPYLPLDHALQGCFGHFSKLFGIKFTENKSYPTWHKDVVAYDVTDEKDGSFIGTIYCDFHPRKGKNGGAWMNNIRPQGLLNGKVERPITIMVCNFTKPSKGTPSLITHDELVTLFHEMGHELHGLLSNVKYRSLSGVNVRWDFVELPSQVQENWAFTPETLAMVSKHYKDGTTMPAELIKKLNDAKNFMAGWVGLRQVGLGMLDMKWHTTDPKTIANAEKFEDEVMKDLRFFPRLAGLTTTSFTHIFSGGYSAGYYSYKWAEVLDADVFAHFRSVGLYDRKTADAYRNKILARGGSAHPAELYRDFMGRNPDPDALLRREGLLKAANSAGQKPGASVPKPAAGPS